MVGFIFFKYSDAICPEGISEFLSLFINKRHVGKNLLNVTMFFDCKNNINQTRNQIL